MSTPQLLPFGYDYTIGNQIVDASGNDVRISAINWFGMETGSYAPGGLQVQNYKTMMNEMVTTGFNTVRLPFSLQLFAAGSKPSGINYTLNPDLKGLSGLGVMDAIVAYAGQIGLKVILDDHRSSAYSGANSNGLWYDDGYTSAQWLSTWQMLATHYAGNSTVIGADLANEPHGQATWGTGTAATDWHAAATQGGDAIQAINPNWLIFVQGIQTYNGSNTWWGSNLQGVATDPVVLNTSNHLVYEVHEYPSSVGWQPWFGASNYPNNLPSVWTQNWGYIYQQNIAPVFVGEIGTKLQTTSDQQWLTTLDAYLNSPGGTPAGGQGISWGYWAWNPTSGDTGGILESDWTTIDQAKVAAISSLFFYPSTVQAAVAVASTATSSATANAGTPVAATTTTPSTTTPATTATATAVVYTPIDGGAAGSSVITLGDGNFSIGISGTGNTITAGNGSSVVGIGAYAPLGASTITLGTGNSIVTAFGTGNAITAGDGNTTVVGPQGGSTVSLGNGDQIVVLFGTANSVTIGDTASPADPTQASLVNAGSGSETVRAGDGTVFILASGASDIITTGTSGTANSRAFVFLPQSQGGAAVTTGAGNDWIVLGGQHNSVDGGAGGNVIWSGQGSDIFTLETGGTDYLYGFNAGAGDRLDLSHVLAGLHVTPDNATLARFIQVSAVGGNAYVSVDTGGHGSFTGGSVAVLEGEGALSLSALQQLGGLVLPTT